MNHFEDQLDDFFVGPSNINSDESILDSIRSLPLTPFSSHKSSDINFEDYDKSDTRLADHDGLFDDAAIDLGARLQKPTPFNDGMIAFGTIQIYNEDVEEDGDVKTFIRGRNDNDLYPNMLMRQGIAKRWIRMDGISIGTRSHISTLRVYILPEDVDRSDRGSLKDFRKLVKYMLDYIDCSTEAWEGKKNTRDPITPYEEPLLEEEQSLFYIFNTLKSPKTDLTNYNGDVYSYEAITDVARNTITGLKTKLYPYQQRSIVAMVKRESDPAKIKDLRKHKFLDMYNTDFYLDLQEGSLCRHRPLYLEPQGGVLAETMGYGKTLICLALVLATRGHYSKLPSQHVDISRTETNSSVPSLLEIAARKLRHEGLPWKNDFYNLRKAGYHYDRCIAELQKHERVYNALQTQSAFLNPSRRGKPEYVNPIRLCSVTLVVVPPNLIIQWQQEIQRHVEADAIDLLVLDKATVSIPSWQELTKYDVVLISKARFEQEYRDDDLNQGRMAKGETKYKSPLTEVRWLRVICDEGHGFAGSSSKTKAMAMLDKMAIERRWVVSGTPSSTLHGVEVGLAAVESTSVEGQLTSREDSLRLALKSGRSPESLRIERTDFERLRLMVVNFLKLQPWSNRKGDDKADFKQYLAPRLCEDGSRRSVPALREVIQTLMVRHRIEDIDRDLVLPHLHNKVVYIEPSYYDRLTINLFVMILISNYVTSEREDEDYMFHPRNRKKLSTLISNMIVATFHWMGITETDVRSTINISSKYLDEHIDKVSDEDGILLTEAIMSGERALADLGWCAFSTMHEIGTFVMNFPEDAREAWALDGLGTDPLLMGTTQAREVQRHVQAGILAENPDPLHGIVGAGLKIMNAARGKANEFLKQTEKLVREESEQSSQIGTKDEPKVRATFTNQSPVKLQGRKNSMRSPSNSQITQTSSREAMQLPDTRVLGFSSSKLTYLTHRLLHVHSNEKTIIFYTNNNTAFFIAEALELLQITFRIYANTLSVGKRAEYLAQFNAEAEFNVLLMDLKQAALGLHIAVASRVYIISPIWDPSLESQAIKRAHRIGQTREVFVETLVLAGTFEESMVHRRAEKLAKETTTATKSAGTPHSASNDPDSKADDTTTADKRDMLNDSEIVKVLKSIRFSKIRDNEDKVSRLDTSVPLFHKPPTNSKSDLEPDVGSMVKTFNPSDYFQLESGHHRKGWSANRFSSFGDGTTDEDKGDVSDHATDTQSHIMVTQKRHHAALAPNAEEMDGGDQALAAVSDDAAKTNKRARFESFP